MTVQESYMSARTSLEKQRDKVLNAKDRVNDAQRAYLSAKAKMEYQQRILRLEEEELGRVQRIFESWAQDIDQ